MTERTHPLTRAALAVVVGDRGEIGLGDACRNLERELENRNVLIIVDRRWVSALLRQMGWSKVGWIGSGYDREPLYRRAA